MKLNLARTSGRYRYLYLYIMILSSIVIATLYQYKISDYIAFYDDTLKTINEESQQLSAKYYKEGKKREPVFINLPNSDQLRAIVENYESPVSLWALVNKSRQLPSDYVPSGLIVPNLKSAASLSVRAETVGPLSDMFTDALKAGHQLIIASAYRSYNEQQALFNNSAASVGSVEANRSIAIPGQSEHQTGLALDLAASGVGCYILACFSTTSAGQWLAANAHLYGFIVRYPEGKESTTGYIYEPWHFRYVGKDLATALYQSNLTLEEAWPFMRQALSTLVANEAITLQ